MFEVWLSRDRAVDVEVDLLAIPVRSIKKQGILKTLDQATEGTLLQLAKAQEFEGKRGQVLCCPVWQGVKAQYVVLLGVGTSPEDDRLSWMQMAAQIAKTANQVRANSAAVWLEGKGKQLSLMVEAIAMAVPLTCYRFLYYKKDGKSPSLESLGLILASQGSAKESEALEQLLTDTDILVKSICSARDLVNEPPNQLTPAVMAERAREMAEQWGLKCTVFDAKALRKQGMNLLLAVASGSVQEPRLIHLVYKPPGRKKHKCLALVGKGVTFDSGGLSLKPSNSMINMHADMAGAAAVFGAMQAIAQLQPSVEVHGILAATENMTGAAAYKLNDVILGLNQKTVEILNTDAEGRLALADALVYACRQGATQIIDVATLTGACMVALGRYTAGLMGNSQLMIDELLFAAQEAGESVWQLPLLEPLREGLKSSVADLTNLGDRYGGAISAGLFLQEFVEENVQWAHLDIAGPAFLEKERDYIPKGGSGFAVATLTKFILQSS